jgi:hypothetical protein
LTPRLGAPLGTFHASLLHCLLPQLSSPRLAVRKRAVGALGHLAARAVGALGHLAAACSTDLFVELADHLLDRLPGPRAPASPPAIRTLIQCLGSVGRQAGHRLGEGKGRGRGWAQTQVQLALVCLVEVSLGRGLYQSRLWRYDLAPF